MIDLDELLDDAVLEAAVAMGRDPRLAARQFSAAAVARVAGADGIVTRGTHVNRWSAADNDYLRQWCGTLSVAELAARLGRTGEAINIQRKRLGLGSVLHDPDWVTGTQMAKALGVDGHSTMKLIERGILPAEPAPLEMAVWRTTRTAFYAWATNPLNWVYFIRSVREPERIRDEKLRRLIIRRAALWGDEWWSIGEAADYHGVIHQEINCLIRAGRLPAVKWGNWWVLRSAATRPDFRVYRVEDGRLHQFGTPAGDAFLVLAGAVGVPWSHIGRMMGKKFLEFRYKALVRQGAVPWLARLYELPIQTRDGAVWWADWRDAAHRFPVLTRAWARLAAGCPVSRMERGLLLGVLRAFGRYHGVDVGLPSWGDATAEKLRAAQRLYEMTLPR